MWSTGSGACIPVIAAPAFDRAAESPPPARVHAVPEKTPRLLGATNGSNFQTQQQCQASDWRETIFWFT
jgi:hypothetical protein